MFRPLFSIYCRNREIFSFIFLKKLKTGNFSFCSTGDILFTASQRQAKIQIKKLTLMVPLFKSWYFTTSLTFCWIAGNSRRNLFCFLPSNRHFWPLRSTTERERNKNIFFTQSVQYEQQCKSQRPSQLAADVSLSAKQV